MVHVSINGRGDLLPTRVEALIGVCHGPRYGRGRGTPSRALGLVEYLWGSGIGYSSTRQVFEDSHRQLPNPVACVAIEWIIYV